MRYSPDFFITKFSNIPEESWAIGYLIDDLGRKCVLGHCILDQSKVLNQMFQEYLHVYVEEVNDGCCYGYFQLTPKARILAALENIKKIIESE